MPLDEAYFVWLYSQVGSVKLRNRSKTYWELLRLLYDKEFTWSVIDKDGNRAKDGQDLRKDFLDEKNIEPDDPSWMAMGCSVLELLVALSWKLAWDGERLTSSDWFWVLIKNLGLIECTDANRPEAGIVDDILDVVINRAYAPNGAGGLFPLTNPHEDQRDVEIWYQAQAFLLQEMD